MYIICEGADVIFMGGHESKVGKRNHCSCSNVNMKDVILKWDNALMEVEMDFRAQIEHYSDPIMINRASMVIVKGSKIMDEIFNAVIEKTGVSSV